MKAFTLIEILVSVAIFSVVMVIALGALLAMSSSDRKAESIKSVVNNLDFALDSMSRAIRTGTAYNCNSSAGGDCASGGTALYFTPSSGVVVAYKLDTSSSDCNQPTGPVGCIARASASDGFTTWSAITSPDVIITNSDLFYLRGAAVGSPNNTQPIVNITISGYVVVNGGVSSQAGCFTGGVPNGQCSVFQLETSVTQRVYDQ